MVTRDKIQSWLFVVCVRRPFMFQSYYQRPVVPFIYYDIQAAPAYEVTISQKVWYSELVVLIINSFLYRELLLTRELLNNWFLVVQVITSKVLRSPPWLGKSLGNICITNDHIICYMLFLFYSHYGLVLFHGISPHLKQDKYDGCYGWSRFAHLFVKPEFTPGF